MRKKKKTPNGRCITDWPPPPSDATRMKQFAFFSPSIPSPLLYLQFFLFPLYTIERATKLNVISPRHESERGHDCFTFSRTLSRKSSNIASDRSTDETWVDSRVAFRSLEE